MTRNAGRDGKRGVRRDDAAPARFAEDGFYRAMASEARRRILHHLLEREASTVRELATVLAGGDAATTPEDRRAREIELRHLHLPLLVDVGLVRHERGTDAVELVDVDPAVRDLVDRSVPAETN